MASATLCGFAVWVLFTLHPATGSYRVFGSFWASGRAASQGLNPYAIYPLTWTFFHQPDSQRIADLNLNPPALLPLLQALSILRPYTAFLVWTLLSVILFTGAAGLLVREYQQHLQKRQVLWLLLSWAAFHTLWLGQDYAVLFALAIFAWIALMRDRAIVAGVCLGILVAIKPNYALWVFLLLLTRRTRASAVAALVFGILCCIPIVLYSPLVYAEWLHAVATDPHSMFSFEVSLIGLATRLGHQKLGLAASVALLLASCIFVARKRPSLRQTSGIALGVAILSSPLAWFHYSLLFAGPLLHRRWNWFLSLAVLPLMLPLHGSFYLVSVCCITGYFFWSE